MAIKFTTTSQEATHCKICVYGRSGAGKTTLIKTAPKPLIISTEQKLLALRKEDIPTILVETVEDMYDAIKYCTTKEARKKFETICIDSITDIAEAQLIDLKRKFKDPRQAYGELADVMIAQIRSLKEIKEMHVYAIAKARRVDDDGVQKLMPSMPGQTLLNGLSYHFDFVFLLDVADDEEGGYRFLQTQPTYKADAKSCGDALKPMEKPDLSYIFKKALK